MLDQIIMTVKAWDDFAISRMLTIFASLYVLAIIVNRIRMRRVPLLSAVFWCCLGLGGILVAIIPGAIFELQQVDFETRTRLAAGLLSAVVLLVTFDSLRRGHMQENYALLWVFTGILIFLCASNPEVASILTRLTGLDYAQSIIAVLFTFLVLVAFHYSLALSNSKDANSRLVQRLAVVEARLEAVEKTVGQGGDAEASDRLSRVASAAATRPKSTEGTRNFFGRDAWLLITALGLLAVLITGLTAPGPMIGDEVTHYYMLVENAEQLPETSFDSRIPVPWAEGGVETRTYPHSNLWHYAGAYIYRILGSSSWSVQVYQALFLLQLILAALAFTRGGGPVSGGRDAVLVLTLLSIPSIVLFSVAFYLDVPATAQVVTAFAFLRRRHWLAGAVFLGLGCMMKETILLMAPGYLYCAYRWMDEGWRLSKVRVVRMMASGLIICVFCGISAAMLRTHDHDYHALKLIEQVGQKVGIVSKDKPKASASQKAKADAPKKNPPKRALIAAHPGDLRQPVNWVVYAGVVLWGVLLSAAALAIFPALRKGREVKTPSASGAHVL